jgi:hypothetical protein
MKFRICSYFSREEYNIQVVKEETQRELKKYFQGSKREYTLTLHFDNDKLKTVLIVKIILIIKIVLIIKAVLIVKIILEDKY